MNNYERLKSMPIDELAKWLDQNGIIDNSPWNVYFDNKYCANCESIMCKYEDVEKVLEFKPFYSGDVECAYCEIYNECRYFENFDGTPGNLEVIKMWLESEEVV